MLVKIKVRFVDSRLSEMVYIEVDEFEFDKYFKEIVVQYSWNTLKDIHPRLSEHILKNYPEIRRNVDSISSIEFRKYFGTKFEM